MRKPLKVLLVEDSEDDSTLLLRELYRSGYDVKSVRVDTRQDMESALAQTAWEVILSDYSMPHFSGLAALEVYQQKRLDIPFIIVSGAVGEASAVEVMRSGAHDYLMKDNLTRLGAVIDRELRETEIRHQRKLAEQALRLTQFAVDHASHAITWFDINFSIVYLNDETARLFGYSRDELVGKKITNFLPSLSDEMGLKIWQDVKQSKTKDYETAIRRSDDTIRNVDINANFVNFEGRELLITFTRDITEKKQAENQLKTLNRALRVISECNQALIRANEESDLFEDICRIIVDYGGYRFAWIGYILQGEEKTILPVGKYGQEDRFLQLREINWSEGQNRHEPTATAIRTQKPAIIHDFESDSLMDAWRSEAIKRGFSSAIAFPLIFQKDNFGVLEIFSEDKNAFISEEVALLVEMAGDLSFGIHTLRVRTEQRLTEFLLEQSHNELNTAYDATLEGWSHALELREKETAGHSQRVVSLTLALAEMLGIKPEEMINVRRGALLHDIGKMGIPDSILLKPGPLSDDEWVIMRQHPIYAYQLLGGIPYLQHALDIPYAHHEKWDGTGYPRGLKGKEIPLSARVFALVDVWDALTSDRPYRLAWPESEARTYIKAQSGKHFDPEVVEIFLKLVNL
jgi:PAS domain S-box-containing protein